MTGRSRKTTRLGRTGLTVSRLCLGCMTYGVPDRHAPIAAVQQMPNNALLRERFWPSV